MGLIASTSPVWSQVTGTNGSGNGSITTEFYDNSGRNFKLTHSGSTYQGIRLNSPYHKNFRMSYEWRGSNSLSYHGPFWGNTDADEIWGGNATGMKLVFKPGSSGYHRYCLRDTHNNQNRNDLGREVANATIADGSTWHSVVVEVKGQRVKITQDGEDHLTCGFLQHGGTNYDNLMNTQGYCGILLYTGTMEVRNFTMTDLGAAGDWEELLTWRDTGESSSLTMDNIFDEGYTSIKAKVNYLGLETAQTDLRLRFRNESNSDYTNANYYSSAAVIGSNSATTGEDWYYDGHSQGYLWRGIWNNASGGVHGEFTIDNYTLSHKVLNNTMSHKGTYNNILRPIVRFDFAGYQHVSGDEGYVRQSGMIRYNTNHSHSDYGGFRIYAGSGDVSRDVDMTVYGLKPHNY